MSVLKRVSKNGKVSYLVRVFIEYDEQGRPENGSTLAGRCELPTKGNLVPRCGALNPARGHSTVKDGANDSRSCPAT